MGINGLFKLIKDKAPSALRQIPLSNFHGKRIAIDGQHWMYTHLNVAHRKIVMGCKLELEEPDRDETLKLWWKSALESLSTWLRYGITPLFVFDGKHPEEKSAVQKERQDRRKANLQELKDVQKQIREAGPFPDSNLVERMRKLYLGGTAPNAEEQQRCISLLEALGLPCLDAEGDGERLCSLLSIDGQVSAVFSGDGDNLVHGCPLLLTGMGSLDEKGKHTFTAYSLPEVLCSLGLTFEQFQDLCILLGCDYNEHITGIGPVKALSLIREFGRLDHFPPHIDQTLLKVAQCRNLFRFKVPDIDLGDFNVQLSPSFHDVFEMEQMPPTLISRLASLIHNLPPSSSEERNHPPSQRHITFCDSLRL